MSAATEFRWSATDPKQDQSGDFGAWFAHAPICMAQCQEKGAVVLMNPALERLLDSNSISSRPLALADLFGPEHQVVANRLLKELLRGERDHFEVEASSSASVPRPMRWTAWRVPASQTRDACVLALGEPHPANAETEQRIRQAQRLEAVGRLAGGVAHDFNNLLTGVLLYCDLLMGSLEPGDRIRRYAEEIRNAGVQASALVRQLLTISRPSNYEPRLLSLNEIAESMRNLLVRLIGENLELELRLDPNLGLVKMDPTQAQQILLNLVLNSRDALPSGGQITVETRNCKVQVLKQTNFEKEPANLPCALLVVADNGIGMDAVTRSRMFDAFFTTKATNGTGLGMATVHDAVTSSGGLIHVDSTPGAGTRISVLLPLAPETITDSTEIQNSREEEFVAPQKE